MCGCLHIGYIKAPCPLSPPPEMCMNVWHSYQHLQNGKKHIATCLGHVLKPWAQRRLRVQRAKVATGTWKWGSNTVVPGTTGWPVPITASDGLEDEQKESVNQAYVESAKQPVHCQHDVGNHEGQQKIHRNPSGAGLKCTCMRRGHRGTAFRNCTAEYVNESPIVVI